MGPTLKTGANHYGPFDRATLWERVNEDMDLLRDLLHIFSQEYPVMLEKLGAAVESRSPAEIAKYGHKLKGSALQFSAMGTAATAARLEKMGETGMLDDADKLYEQLKGEVMELVEALRRMTRNNGSSA